IRVDSQDGGLTRATAALTRLTVLPQVVMGEQGTLVQARFDLANSQLRYVSPVGQLRDPTVYDWRDDLDRLRHARPEDVETAAILGSAPGTAIVFISPVVDPPAPPSGNEWVYLTQKTTHELLAALMTDQRVTLERTVDVDGVRLTILRRRVLSGRT